MSRYYDDDEDAFHTLGHHVTRWRRARAHRRAQAAQADAERRVLYDAAFTVNAEAARVRAEQRAMPDLDMEEGRWWG